MKNGSEIELSRNQIRTIIYFCNKKSATERHRIMCTAFYCCIMCIVVSYALWRFGIEFKEALLIFLM